MRENYRQSQRTGNHTGVRQFTQFARLQVQPKHQIPSLFVMGGQSCTEVGACFRKLWSSDVDDKTLKIDEHFLHMNMSALGR
jgi:hypothetical protein